MTIIQSWGFDMLLDALLALLIGLAFVVLTLVSVIELVFPRRVSKWTEGFFGPLSRASSAPRKRIGSRT